MWHSWTTQAQYLVESIKVSKAWLCSGYLHDFFALTTHLVSNSKWMQRKSK